MRAHEAGALHADGYGGPPQWLPYPQDINELLPQLWSSTVRRDDAGRLEVGGVDVVHLATEFGTPAYVVDEADFRARARAFRDTFTEVFGGQAGNDCDDTTGRDGDRPKGGDADGADVYYAGKAFLCTQVARWIDEEGLSLDVCSAGELAVAERAGFPGGRIGMHGNNKSEAEIEAALTYPGGGIGRIVVDSFTEIHRIAAIAERLGVRAPVMVRVTVGVEAHTHAYIATAHEDQKFGFSLSGGQAAKAVREILAYQDELDLRGLHSHIGSQIFDPSGFEVSAHRVLGLHADVAAEHGIDMPELDLGGGFGIAYTSEHTPLRVSDLAASLNVIVRRECAGLGIPQPRISVEPGRAIAGPSTLTLYRVGTVKDVELDGGLNRSYVSVDGGMSDNIRTALYAADYSATIANRASAAAPALSRVVGKHCESGDVLVMDEYLPADLCPGDLVAVPGTGAYCRSLSSQYNHLPRPPVLAVRDGTARVLIRRETITDLLALDIDE